MLKKNILKIVYVCLIIIPVIILSSIIYYINKSADQDIRVAMEYERPPLEHQVKYQNDLWGIEFRYPDNKDTIIQDLGGQVNIYSHSDNLYFHPIAVDSKDVVDFESLKAYLDQSNTSHQLDILKNNNGIYFYRVNIDSRYTDYYTFYHGRKPFNAVKFSEDSMDPRGKKIFEGIIKNFSFIKSKQEKLDVFFQENGINPDCAGWYATREYSGKNRLRILSDTEDIAGKKGYTLFQDKNVSFYYPSSWQIEVFVDKSSKNGYRIYYLYSKEAHLDIILNNIDDFKYNYRLCIKRCFGDANPTAPISWMATTCSEDYSEENLSKILSGNYINYLWTGPLPPGGSGSFNYNKVSNGMILSARYASEYFQFYPQAEQISNQSGDYLNEEQKKIIKDEQEYYDEEFYKIIKSAHILDDSIL